MNLQIIAFMLFTNASIYPNFMYYSPFSSLALSYKVYETGSHHVTMAGWELGDVDQASLKFLQILCSLIFQSWD